MLSGKFKNYDDMVAQLTAKAAKPPPDPIQTLDEMLKDTDYSNLFGYHDYDNLKRLDACVPVTRKALVGYACAVARVKEQKGPWVELIAPEFKTVPIPEPDRDDKFVVMKDKPVPVRKDPPVYEDIAFAMNLFSHESICKQQDSLDWTAQRLGKSRSLLTPKDFPCDFYYPGFMEKPAEGSPVSLKSDASVSAMISVFSESQTKKFVSIWADGGTAYLRYAAAGATHITVIVPEGYDFSSHVATLGHMSESFPDVEVFVHTRNPSVSELISMTSVDFISAFSLDPESYFVSTYLPQFAHLKDGFADYSIICMDSDSVIGCPRVSIPSHFSSKSELERYLLCWLAENFPQEVRSGRFMCYDPGKNIIVSYAEHGVFVDYLFDPAKAGDPSYSVFDLTLYSSRKNFSSSLKVIRKSFRVTDITDGSITVLPAEGMDVSVLRTFNGCLYVPSWNIFRATSSNDGTVVTQGRVFTSLPVRREVLFIETPEGPKVLDIKYGRKRYSDRVGQVPLDDLYVPSPYLLWDYAYVIFPSSLLSAVDFYVDRHQLYKYLVTPRAVVESQVMKLCGVGWNWNLKRLVYDRTSFMSWSPQFLVSPVRDYRNNAWFADDDKSFHAYTFEGSGFYWVIDGSWSEEALTADDVGRLFDSLPPGLQSAAADLEFFANRFTL